MQLKCRVDPIITSSYWPPVEIVLPSLNVNSFSSRFQIPTFVSRFAVCNRTLWYSDVVGSSSIKQDMKTCPEYLPNLCFFFCFQPCGLLKKYKRLFLLLCLGTNVKKRARKTNLHEYIRQVHLEGTVSKRINW